MKVLDRKRYGKALPVRGPSSTRESLRRPKKLNSLDEEGIERIKGQILLLRGVDHTARVLNPLPRLGVFTPLWARVGHPIIPPHPAL